MNDFLFYIGYYNFLGSILLACLHSEKLANTVLKTWTEVIAKPYQHGQFGKMWLWWAASSNLFLGAIMVLAVKWPFEIQQQIVALVLVVYLIMYLVMLIGGKKPTFGKGIYVTHILWLAQMAWGVYILI